jgi:hypothetical protein
MREALRPIPSPSRPISCRAAERALPPYRYVPGLNAHPFRDPNGSMVNHPKPDHWDASISWELDIAYLHGCDLFDNRYLWEAHETWEGIWHQVPKTDPYRDLLQGLIQAAAAVLKQHMDFARASATLHERCRARFEAVVTRTGPNFRGLDLTELMDRLERHRQRGEWPTLPLQWPTP